MNTRILFFVLALFIGSLNAIAQNSPICGVNELTKLEVNARKMASTQLTAADPNTVFTLPVVFVVYHLGESVGTGSNLSDAKLNDELAKLNDAFRARGAFAGLNDTKIQFELAKYDANCASASGIVRVNASGVAGYAANGLNNSDNTTLQALRALHSWNNRDEYITIELVHKLNGAAGYAGYLSGYLVIDAQAYWYGLTAHEMGHCLNLRHTFEGDNGGSQCPPNTDPENQGDLISDTDPHKTGDFCLDAAKSETSINECSGVAFGKLLRNFMSYNGPCWDRFTPKQIERMRNSLVSFRSQWLASKALTGLTSPPVASAVERCGSGTVTLTASACSGTYNWYSSASGGSSLGTSATYTTPNLTANTTYYVSCTGSSCPESGRTPVAITIKPAAIAQPSSCIPTATNGLSTYFGISSFSFSTIARTGGQSSLAIGSNYSDLSCSVSTTVQAGNTYPFTISSLFGNTVIAKIFIDYNSNGNFDDIGELVYNSNGNYLATHTGTIVVPTNTTVNTGLRMRVMIDPFNMTSCSLPGLSQYGSGRAEDFAVTITPSTCTPPAAPTVNSVSINSGLTATLTASNCTGSVKWYDQQTGGTLLYTGNPYTTNALIANVTYYASCIVNNCESTSRGSGTVTVNCTPPAAPTVNSVSINSGLTATLTASNCTGSVKWYDQQTGGTLLFTGNPYTTNALTANVTYYASCTVNNCESTTRGSGTVTVSTGACAVPTGMQWSDRTTQSFRPRWQGIAGYNYVVRYRIQGSAAWTETAIIPCTLTGGVSTTLLNLATGRTYEWQVKAICSIGNESAYSVSTLSTIDTASPPCTSTLTHSTATLSAGVYQASQTIASQANVVNNTKYFAGQSVLLQPGFKVNSTQPFTVNIEGCPTQAPALQFTGTSTFTANGQNYTSYGLSVSNFSVFPNSLFAAAPTLPLCGTATNTARTWVYVYDATTGQLLSYFCTLSNAASMTGLAFSRVTGIPAPTSVYVDIYDRFLNLHYVSTAVTIP
ncbi:hypothetical protein FHS57_006055 [Runella defluvii]|uniref:Fibronectin type-III domain-containing protein n=1 Tax=Runella defluvii TaxID=370973 RepID=A0A7W6EU41_9BACT|nr:M43 family zinc metalloprotease [Runella defluvii]MBB3842026.1 hypothetical protein [Runella defluvii]